MKLNVLVQNLPVLLNCCGALCKTTMCFPSCSVLNKKTALCRITERHLLSPPAAPLPRNILHSVLPPYISYEHVSKLAGRKGHGGHFGIKKELSAVSRRNTVVRLKIILATTGGSIDKVRSRRKRS